MMLFQDIPIFDSLTHIKKDGNWYGTHCDASLEKLLRISKTQFKKAALVGMPGDDNEYLMHIAKLHPDKFVPIGALNIQKNANLEEIESALLKLSEIGFKGVKIHPRFLGINIADELVSKIIGIAGKYELVIFLCTVQKPPSPPLKRPVYDVIHQICDENQESKIIFLHGGYYDLLATSEILRYYENTLLDLSATLTRFYKSSILNDCLFLFETFDKRICIGSDFPEGDMNQIIKIISETSLREVNACKLKNILWTNLNNFLSIYE